MLGVNSPSIVCYSRFQEVRGAALTAKALQRTVIAEDDKVRK